MAPINDRVRVGTLILGIVVCAGCSEPTFPEGEGCWADDGEWSGSVDGAPFTLAIEYVLDPARCSDGPHFVGVDWRWSEFGGDDQYSAGTIDQVDSVGTFDLRLRQSFDSPYCSRRGALVGEFASARRMEGFLTLDIAEELEGGFCSETPVALLDSLEVTLVRSP
ncbi:MAG: hypothetical protein R3304_11275 [Longimicrobiales bacterium]|nr:hypothetical protein [Longimicrobiales bacterium]